LSGEYTEFFCNLFVAYDTCLLFSLKYLQDFDFSTLCPGLSKDLEGNFLCNDIFPKGVNSFVKFNCGFEASLLGPNLFAGKGSCLFTAPHTDAAGLDSGHISLSDKNQIVILRRLPSQDHEIKALELLAGNEKGSLKYTWPNSGTLDTLEALGYCPIVLTIDQGDLIHINKGRAHFFRKEGEDVSISVAWDFFHFPSTGSSYNLASELFFAVRALNEAVAHNRKRGKSEDKKPVLFQPHMFVIQAAEQALEQHKKGATISCDEKRKKIKVQDLDGTSLAQALIPILKYLEHVSKQEEKIETTVSSCESLGIFAYDSGRFRCSKCESELWGYFFQSQSGDRKACCCSCNDVATKSKRKMNKFLIRSDICKSERLAALIRELKTLACDEPWWEEVMVSQLIDSYSKTLKK